MDEGKQLVEGDVTITAILSDKRQINIRTHLYVGEDTTVRNFRVDAMNDMVDRQMVRADIIVKQAEFAQHEAGEIALAEHYEALIEKQKHGKLPSAEKRHLDDYEKTKATIRTRKESALAAIAAARHKLNGAAPQ